MKIGIITSGGDSPGMNAFILELCKLCRNTTYEVLGFKEGYNGIEKNNFMFLNYSDLMHMNLSKKGGSFLLSGRNEKLKNLEELVKFKKKIEEANLDWIIVLGGDGSLKAASKLCKMGCKIIGVPATIDNNVNETDYTLGFDTARNKTLQNINDIEDTASAMPGKIYLIETLGGDCGNIAKEAVEEGAADFAIIPEESITDEEITKRVEKVFNNQNKYCIITICEGLQKTIYYSELLKNKLERKVHITIIGHMQRGGCPTAYDRYMARNFAKQAFELIKDNKSGVMVGYKAGKVIDYNLL